MTEQANAPDFLQRLLAAGRGLLAAMLRDPGRFDAPGDPEASVREPRHRSPGGLNSAIALAEPSPPEDVRAVGRWRGRPDAIN